MKTLKSTAFIVIERKGPDGKPKFFQGTGSLVNRTKKVVLTNVHVIDEAVQIRVFFPKYDKDEKLITENSYYMKEFRDGNGLRGRVKATDPGRDLALVELDGTLDERVEAIPLARKGQPLVSGQRNMSIGGNARGSQGQWVSSTGTIRQVYQRRWKPAGYRYDLDALVVEVQSPTNAGDSGGPVVNVRAEQIAVTQGGIDSADTHLMSWAIHIDQARKLMEDNHIEPRDPEPVAFAVLDVKKFQDALKSKNLKTCRRAAARLLEFGPAAEPLTKELIEALRHADALVRQYAARALGEIGEAAGRHGAFPRS